MSATTWLEEDVKYRIPRQYSPTVGTRRSRHQKSSATHKNKVMVGQLICQPKVKQISQEINPPINKSTYLLPMTRPTEGLMVCLRSGLVVVVVVVMVFQCLGSSRFHHNPRI